MREWNEPRRDEVLASAPEVPAHKSRKNTRDWCKGKVGRPHNARIRLQRHIQHRIDAGGDPARWASCRWGMWFFGGDADKPRVVYRCHHEVFCEVCGKILHPYLGWSKCPDAYPGPDLDKLGELACDHCGLSLDEHRWHNRDREYNRTQCPRGKNRFWWNGDPVLNELLRRDDDE